jgi:hypothetical protein
MEVQDDGNYIFKAGNSIEITAPTTLKSGTYTIEPCSSNLKSTKNNVSSNADTLSITEVNKNELLDLTPSLNTSEAVEIFPNPTSGIFNVSFYSENQEMKRIEVYNIIGLLIQSYNNSNAHNIIDISDYSNGIYILRISIGSKEFQKKLIKKINSIRKIYFVQ